jgi:hypothetical protein
MKTIKVKDLMSISGKGGLFRYLAQARNGVVVESLGDKKRTVVPSTASISALDDISIFSEKEDIPLSDVFFKIHEKEEGKVAIDPKSDNAALKAYFAEILPKYDEDRVYISDIKKVIIWYNLLHKYELLEVIEKEEENGEVENGEESGEEKTPKNKTEKSED